MKNQKEIIIKIKHNLTPFHTMSMETGLLSVIEGLRSFLKSKSTKSFDFEIMGLETDEAKSLIQKFYK